MNEGGGESVRNSRIILEQFFDQHSFRLSETLVQAALPVLECLAYRLMLISESLNPNIEPNASVSEHVHCNVHIVTQQIAWIEIESFDRKRILLQSNTFHPSSAEEPLANDDRTRVG